MTKHSRVLIIGGPDVNSRISLIQILKDHFSISVLGSDEQLTGIFKQAGIGFNFYRLNRGTNPSLDLFTFWQLVRIISDKGVEIVHTFDTKPGVWGRLAAKIAGVPIIIGTLPGLGSLYSENNLRIQVIRSIYQPLQRLACHYSDLTVFQNPEDATQFIENGIVPDKKVDILQGSGVNTKTFDSQRFSWVQRQQIRKMLGLNDTHVVVTMISRMIRSKGVVEFAHAAQAIRQQYLSVVFLLIGPDDPESMDSLNPVEKELICNSTIRLGARDDIPELLAITDVFVLPTYYREGIPRVLLEAASMGLPIVATKLPGCMEVVVHNANGFLVPPRDVITLIESITKLIVDSSLREHFGQASRQRAVACFDLAIIAQRTASIYNRLLAQKGYGDTTNS